MSGEYSAIGTDATNRHSYTFTLQAPLLSRKESYYLSFPRQAEYNMI